MISFIAKKNEKYSFEQDAINTMRERERDEFVIPCRKVI